jgi:glycosyltransferase involved in cell wall biosynthesis
LREGLPRTIVQSLACGKPAIAFDLDGAPEVIKNDRTGYIAEPENYIQVAEYAIKLLNDEKLVKDMGENGRNLVCKQFSWRQMGDILEKEYEKGVREKI